MPSKTTLPSVGWYSRLRQLKSVVLPAPLGPISAQIWPSSIVNVKSDSATMPPNSTRTSSTDNNAKLFPPGTKAGENLVATRAIGYRPSSWSKPTVRPGVSPMLRMASSTPGMNDERSIVSWRIDSVWPLVPSTTS